MGTAGALVLNSGSHYTPNIYILFIYFKIDVFEGVGVRDGVAEQEGICALIAQWPQPTVIILPCRVPDLHGQSAIVDGNLCLVAIKHSGHMLLWELIINIAKT